MKQNKEAEHQPYFTGNIVVDFLIVAIPPLPGILAYIIAKELIGDLWFGLPSVLAGVGWILLCYPLTRNIVNKIRGIGLGGKG